MKEDKTTQPRRTIEQRKIQQNTNGNLWWNRQKRARERELEREFKQENGSSVYVHVRMLKQDEKQYTSSYLVGPSVEYIKNVVSIASMSFNTLVSAIVGTL